MDALRAMQVFIAVTQHGGFAAAARALGLSTSSVSRHVANLEDAFGAQLLHRSPRHLRLTPAGEDLLGQCGGLVQELERILRSRGDQADAATGRLRVTMPFFLGSILMKPVVAEFLNRHPKVEIEVLMLDRMVNLVEEGFDLALRVGRQPDSALMSRKVLELHLALIASEAYLAAHGRPERPEDLRAHNCIIDTAAPYRDRWPLRTEAGVARMLVRGNAVVSSGSAARDLAAAGVGLALLPEYLVFDDIDQGRVATVMDAHMVDFGGVFLIYPQSRHRSAAIRSFAELVVAHAKPIQAYRAARERR